MKRLITSVLTFILLFSLAFQAVYAAPPIRIKVGGTELETDVAPLNIDGRILLPVRAVFEAIGAKVTYNAAEKKVEAVKKDRTVSFIIGEKAMTVNGNKKETDVAATIKNNRTLVPLRACAEAFDLEVNWNPTTRIASVKKEVSVPVHSITEYTESTKEYNEIGEVSVLTTKSLKNYGGDPRINIYEYTYDENGNCITSTEKDAEGVVVATGYNEYDEYGRVIKSHDVHGDTTVYEYDENGNRIYRGDPNKTGFKWKYNENNLLVYEEDKRNIITYTYNEYNQLIKRENISKDANYLLHITEYTYYPDGRQKSAIGTKNNTLYNVYEYNDKDNEKKCYFKDGTFQIIRLDDEGREIYRKEGNGTEITKEFDQYGNLVRETTKKPGVTEPKVKEYKYTYDANGNILREEKPKDEWSEYTYDANGNMLSEKHSDGTSTEYIVVVK